MSFYVVFEGNNKGVYDSCTQCLELVSGCDDINYEAYDTHDDAMIAWENFCISIGSSKLDFHNGFLHSEQMVKTDTKQKGSFVGGNKYEQDSTIAPNAKLVEEKLAWEKIHMEVTCFAENSNSNKWAIQHNMQEELKYVCMKLEIKPPAYTKEEVRVRRGIPYVRYKVSLEGLCAGEEPVLFYGRFARQSNDAKEDAAVVALRRLLDTTGHKIRDFNYYNVKILEQEIQVLQAEKITMSNVIRTLNEEIDIIIPEAK